MASIEQDEKTKTAEKIAKLLQTIPNQPGVYQFFDKDNKIIYIGKAKNLKKRVVSYFNRDNHESGKIQMLVKRIADIQLIVVDSESDALLLENNLIKKYQPKYNILLKDDKTYPWICIKNEPFPRLFYTRNVVKDGSLYFGPYASGKMMHTLLDLVRQLYQYRTCNLSLTENGIKSGKFKSCLEFQMGNCKAPCIGEQTLEDYNATIAEIKEIIKGNISTILSQLKEKMAIYAASYEYEKAHFLKEKIHTLNNYQSKSAVVNPSISNVDVFSIVSDDDAGYVNYFKVINGSIIQSHTVELKKRLEESEAELLAFAITDLRIRFESTSPEIIVSMDPQIEILNTTFTIPQKGDKKKLLELSENNAKYYRLDKQKMLEKVNPEMHVNRILEGAAKDLRMKELPKHIECFDNSNIQGTSAVAAMVVFKNGKPDKKEYRHFNIKTVEGPDDYASMEEIIFRRYKRLLEENKNLPQLIVIDGGKGQLHAALNSLEKLNLRGKITIISIAKRLEEIYFPGDSLPLYIDKKSETLRLIQQLRDEAHRFGITHHRKKREKALIKTELTDIKGIGEQTANTLLQQFKSIKNIKELSFEQIAEVVGDAKAKIVMDYFHKKT